MIDRPGRWTGGLGHIVPLLLVLAPAIALAWIGRVGPTVGPLVVALGGALVYFLGRLPLTRSGEWPTVALIATLAFAVALVPLSLASALLSGASGLALLFWVSRADASPKGGGELVNALFLTGAAVGIAVVSALLLPAPTADIGVAAALVVGVLVWMAWLFRGSATGVPEAPSSY